MGKKVGIAAAVKPVDLRLEGIGAQRYKESRNKVTRIPCSGSPRRLLRAENAGGDTALQKQSGKNSN